MGVFRFQGLQFRVRRVCGLEQCDLCRDLVQLLIRALVLSIEHVSLGGTQAVANLFDENIGFRRRLGQRTARPNGRNHGVDGRQDEEYPDHPKRGRYPEVPRLHHEFLPKSNQNERFGHTDPAGRLANAANDNRSFSKIPSSNNFTATRSLTVGLLLSVLVQDTYVGTLLFERT